MMQFDQNSIFINPEEYEGVRQNSGLIKKGYTFVNQQKIHQFKR